MLVAVETSDLVGSTKLSDELRSKALSGIKQSLTYLHEQNAGQFEVFRGDAYQVMCTKPELAIKQALLIKLFLLSQLPQTVQVTQSIAIGEVAEPIGTLGENMSPVFVHSGRQLETLQSGYLGLYEQPLTADFLLANAFMNRLIQQLTSKQAEILYWSIKLDFPEQKLIAKKLSMSRQNVNTHMLRANADLFRAFLEQYKNNISGLIK